MNSHKWFLEYKKVPAAKIRLFCFHHSGGGASAYFPWIDHLSPHIELIAIQLPGRECRFNEPLNSSFKDIIYQLSNEFCFYKDKPFFTFGHSLGGLISFEFIKQIYQVYSLLPQHIIISATVAPHLRLRMRSLSQLNNMALKEELLAYNGIDQRILDNEELLDLFLPIIRSDFRILENYSFTGYQVFPCNILALSGIDDHTVSAKEILGWSKYTSHNFEHISFSGGHFFLKEHQEKILKKINQIGNKTYKSTSGILPFGQVL